MARKPRDTLKRRNAGLATNFLNEMNKSNIGHLHVMPFGSYGFLEERCSESHTVPDGLNAFISLFSTEAYHPV